MGLPLTFLGEIVANSRNECLYSIDSHCYTPRLSVAETMVREANSQSL